MLKEACKKYTALTAKRLPQLDLITKIQSLKLQNKKIMGIFKWHFMYMKILKVFEALWLKIKLCRLETKLKAYFQLKVKVPVTEYTYTLKYPFSFFIKIYFNLHCTESTVVWKYKLILLPANQKAGYAQQPITAEHLWILHWISFFFCYDFMLTFCWK